MLLEPRVSDVLTTEENRSHYHGKPWKWEGKCLHATPPPFPAHPLISPSRSALRYQGFSPGDKRPLCAGGVTEPPAGSPVGSWGERGALLPPSLAGGPGAKSSPAPGAAACGRTARARHGARLPHWKWWLRMWRSSHILGSCPVAWSHSPRGKPAPAPLHTRWHGAAGADSPRGCPCCTKPCAPLPAAAPGPCPERGAGTPIKLQGARDLC